MTRARRRIMELAEHCPRSMRYRSAVWAVEVPWSTRRSVLWTVPWVGWLPVRLYLRAADWLLFQCWWYTRGPLLWVDEYLRMGAWDERG